MDTYKQDIQSKMDFMPDIENRQVNSSLINEKEF